ncbi:MAG TPA: maleylpyruvate isomerase N-terminal domain-containing protein [Candidatus Limnocylindria bacterium]|nr:maleylpyruvate isomerase N-terminal domain-containing protein [Candidatus Limnocylindria bacterium]
MAELDPHVQELLDGLTSARDDFLAALADIDPALRTTPGLVGDWSARDLLAHVGYWAGHGAESLHRAELGELSEFGRDDLSVDDRNAVVTRVARETDYATVASREQGSYEAFVARLTAVDPESLDDRDADGDTLEEIIAFDGGDHYREHILDIRAWFDGKDAPDEADAEADAD